MRINRITIDNFKGIKHFEADFGGRSANVYGDNATGKTTIGDALTWLLFDRDTDGRNAFAIKPLDARGNVANHGAETTVRAEFEHGGRVCELTKTYKEVWARKRGSAEAQMSGHKTTYTVDGVPMAAKAYAAIVDSMVPARLVPILSDPMCFADRLEWRERRQILLDIAGAVSDADVLASDPRFAGLAGALNGDSVDMLLARLRADRRAANDELGKIPARMDELVRMLHDEPDDLDTLPERIDAIQHKISALEQPDGDADAIALRDALAAEAAAGNALMQYSAEDSAWASDLRDAARAQMQPLLDERRELSDQLIALQSDAAKAEYMMGSIPDQLEQLRKEFARVASQEWSGDTVCPTCGQDLPADIVDDSRKKFEAQKNARLDEINDRGAKLRADLSETSRQADAANAKIKECRVRLDAVSGMIDAIGDTPAHMDGYQARMDELTAACNQAHDEVARLRGLQSATRHEVAQEISKLRDELRHMQAQAHIPAQNAQINARIEELQRRQVDLAEILANADRLVDDAERFTRAKCDMLQARMDALFARVRWRLWRDQINGGLADCCDALIDGVPFADANHAAQINAGLEIIGVLTRMYKNEMPVLVDNAEAVTQLHGTGGLQVIRLIVSEPDKKLRVEVVK